MKLPDRPNPDSYSHTNGHPDADSYTDSYTGRKYLCQRWI